jgi:hypothetical protein
MTRLSIGYSDSEDRIWIALSEDDRQWWLTRRALLRWVSELARMLGRSDGTQSDAVWTVPPERRVALEHEIATREREPDAPAASDDQVSEAPRTPRRPVLASSITMTLGKQGIATTLHGPGESQRLGLSRIETHRLLGALVRQARTRGWFETMRLPDWLLDLPPQDDFPGELPDGTPPRGGATR